MRVGAHGGRSGSGARGRLAKAVAGAVAALAAVLALPAGAGAAPATGPAPAVQTPGTDVSSGTVDWAAAWNNGARFAYVKATESTSYTNPDFPTLSTGAARAGLLHGAYHFAAPGSSSGRAQADFFVAHGGGWSPDGVTLPPVLDVEASSFGSPCYGLSQAAMAAWIHSFTDEVHARTTRWPVISTSADWWAACTGNDSSFGADDPLFLTRFAAAPGTLPAGWTTWTFWSHAAAGPMPGGQDLFNGTVDQLKALAAG